MLQRLDTAPEQDGLLLRALPLLLWAVVAAVGVLGLISLRWGIAYDAAMLFALSREVVADPIRMAGLLDMNMPLTYWLHAGFEWLFGLNDLAWRLLDLGALAGICALGAHLIRPLAGGFTAAAVVWIAGRHLSGGAFLVGERDILLLVPVLGAALMFVRMAERGRNSLHCSVLAGCLLGTAVMIKPSAALYPPLMLAALYVADKRFREMPLLLKHALALGAGVLVPCVIVAGVLAAQGILVETLAARRLILGIYAGLRANVLTLVWPLLAVALPLALFSAVAVNAGGGVRIDVRLAMLIALTAASLVSYLGHGKGWAYQAAPFDYCGILLCGVLANSAWRSGGRARRQVALITVFLALSLVAVSGFRAWIEIAAAGAARPIGASSYARPFV
ncbi:MAG: hypothetical protein AB7G35_18820, partial [Hyphomicrobiaceae bacterium]